MIKIYKLVSGECLVAEEVDTSKAHVTLNFPVQLLEVTTPEDDGTGFMLSLWLPFAGTQKMSLNRSAIALEVEASEEMMEQYSNKLEEVLSEEEEPVEVPEPIAENRRRCKHHSTIVQYPTNRHVRRYHKNDGEKLQ